MHHSLENITSHPSKTHAPSRISFGGGLVSLAGLMREHALAAKVLLLTLGGQVVLFAALVSHNADLLEQSLEEPFRLRVESMKPLFNSALAQLLVDREYAALAARLQDARSDDDILYLVVRNSDDRIVASTGWDPSMPLPLASKKVLDNDDSYDAFLLIEANGRKIGTLNFGISTRKLLSYRDNMRERDLIILALGVLLIGVVQGLLALHITRRLRMVSSASEEVARGRFDMNLDDSGGDEVARLASSMNAMSLAVRDKIRNLEQSEDNLRMAMDAGSVVPWQREIAGDTLIWGAGVERLLGPLPGGSSGYPDLMAMVDADSGRRLSAACEEAMRSGLDYQCDVRIRRTDGVEGWLAVRGKYVPGAVEGAGYLIGVTRDITSGKRAELEIRRLNHSLEQRVAERTAELQAAVKELEAFSHTISHDLRAPLRAMSSFPTLIREACEARPMPEAAAGLLGRIEKNASRMAQMLDDLMAFSKVSRLPLLRQQVLPGVVVAELMQELHFIEAKSADVIIGQMPVCFADPALLRQVYANLLSNALKYSARVSEPRVEAGAIQTDGDCAVYFVRDNGAGFDMSQAKNLFGVFQRLHSAKEFEGTGVGLSIVHRIVTRHGGRIWADAAPGKGATFYFTVPSAP